MKPIGTVTVLGANGTMGKNIAGIFASFGRARVYMVSRSAEKSEAAKENACQSVRAESIRERMISADYGMLETCIRDSDLIFEACAESWEVKEAVHRQVSELLERCGDTASEKIICSGTSGLSITRLSELYQAPYRGHVIGMHFFNPPYQMPLCELVPTENTEPGLFQDLYQYTRSKLLRTAVVVKDSPAFLGNRIGFQFINEAMRLAEQYRFQGGIDYIDAIFGPFTGRAMVPLVTADFIGLDICKAIADNLYENTDDFAHSSFELPGYVERLVNAGKLGGKSGTGFYKTLSYGNGGKVRQVYDIDQGVYRETIRYIFPFAEKMISFLQEGEYEEAFRELKRNRSTEAELCLSGLLKYILYGLDTAEQVGGSLHSADDAMAAGFNWCPPLALLEALGGKDIFCGLCRERLPQVWMEKERERLILGAGKSRYDYRRFIRAKR